MLKGLSFLAGILICSASFCQQKVSFPSEDKLPVSANYYKGEPSDPFVIFFHQAGSSRGEYADIAPRIKKLGYNCLAVDLRYGGKEQYIDNETASEARARNLDPQPYDAMPDIKASINWAFQLSHKPVILFGSSFSASLCLIAARHDPRVKAVIAFSPGEFFGNRVSVKDSISHMDKPVFIASTSREYAYIAELASGIAGDEKTIFKPAHADGVHGARALWKESPGNEETWLALMLFFRELE